VLKESEAILTDGFLTSEYRWQRADGSYRWILDQAILIRDESGKPKEIAGTWLDITERKEMEEALRKREARFRTLFSKSRDANLLLVDGVHVDCNEACLEMLQATRDQVVGKSPAFLSPERQPDGRLSVEAAQEKIREAMETGSTRFEWVHRRMDGTEFWAEVVATAMEIDGRDGLFGVWRDITERKRVEEALQEGEARYRLLTENTHDLISELDAEGRTVYASPNHMEVLGYEPAELLGQRAFDWVHAGDVESVTEAFRLLITQQGMKRVILRLRHKAGTWRWLECAGSTFTDANGDIRVVIMSRDITERKQAEDALRANEERYRLLAEDAGDLVSELTTAGLYKYVSPSYQTVLGYAPDELLGHDPLEWVHPDDQEEIRAAIEKVVASGIPETRIYRSRHRDGEWCWLEAYGRALLTVSGDTHLVVVMRDITERRRVEEEQRKLEAQMEQTQKLESLGVLAGGIAHDFNNLLVPILGNAHLAEAELASDSPARRFIDRVKTAALRASELPNALLAYAGKGRLATQHVEICQLLREMGELLHMAISRKIEVRYEIPDSLPPLEGDPAQLRQIILNLITNASEAIGDERGVMTVGAGTIDADRRYLSETHLGSGLPEGSYVYLNVCDTGCGMDRETRAKIFDPFFTTKFAGRGLGLAALVGIVRAHRGTLKVESQPGRGTEFRLLFPCVSSVGWRGSGTILVVDDEEVVREILEEVISRYGMSVVTAKDGREAVERFREGAPEITAVLLDVTMPKLGGVEAFLEIRKIQPDARVILSSGYSEGDFAERFAGEEVNGFLHKPYQPEELIEKLRQVLEG
jgi:PAS domain S-box-containing protein